MADTKYIINPVKATLMKYSGKDYGIQGLNDTCFGICSSFNGTYDIDPLCSQSCTDFIEQNKINIFGVGSCDHQVPYRPVYWKQTPRFIPSLLQKGLNLEQSRKTCKNMCNNAVPLLAAECQENCDVDANAVEEYKTPKKVSKSSPIKSINLKEEKQKNPFLFWSVILILIIIIIVLTIYAYKKTR